MIVYGVPALLILDYSVRRGLRYSDLVLLGLIVGVVIEGLAVNTYYTSSAENIEQFATYGRILGVNVNWMVYISIFHAVFSLTVPLAVSLLVLGRDGVEFRLSSRAKKVLLVVLAVVLILFNLSPDTYNPPPQYYILSLLLIIIIYYMHRATYGKQLPPARLKWPEGKPLTLYAPLFVIVAFYILAKILPPTLHLMIGIALFIAIHNTLHRYDVLQPLDAWPAARNLLSGLIVTSILLMILVSMYYLIPSIALFLILTPLLEKRYNRGRTISHENPNDYSTQPPLDSYEAP